MKPFEKVIMGILIGVISYLYIVPPVHETGHLIYGLSQGWRLLAFQVSFPALVEASYVSFVIPTGTPITLFLMAGSLFTLIIGFWISLIPILLRKLGRNPLHHIFLSIGYGLMSDSIFYPISDLIYFKHGDFYRIGLIPSLIVIMFGVAGFLFSIGINKIVKSYRIS